MPNSNAGALVLNLAPFLQQRQSLHWFNCCDRENVHFNCRKAYVTGKGLTTRVEAANFARILCFNNIRNLHVWHAGSNFVWFCSGKKQCLSQAVNFNISTRNFWQNYTSTTKLGISENLPVGRVLGKINRKKSKKSLAPFFLEKSLRPSFLVEKSLRLSFLVEKILHPAFFF